jgi:hypothetical protein
MRLLEVFFMKTPVKTIEELTAYLANMRSWQPYRFGGKWFAVETPEGIDIFRTKTAAQKRNTTIYQLG